MTNRIPLPQASGNRMGENYNSMFYNPLYQIGNKVLIKDMPFVLKEPILKYRDWMLLVDLNQGNFEHISLDYPETYRNFLDDDRFGRYFHLFT